MLAYSLCRKKFLVFILNTSRDGRTITNCFLNTNLGNLQIICWKFATKTPLPILGFFQYWESRNNNSGLLLTSFEGKENKGNELKRDTCFVLIVKWWYYNETTLRGMIMPEVKIFHSCQTAQKLLTRLIHFQQQLQAENIFLLVWNWLMYITHIRLMALYFPTEASNEWPWVFCWKVLLFCLAYEHPQGNEGPALGVFQQTSFLSWLCVREFDTGIEANFCE